MRVGGCFPAVLEIAHQHASTQLETKNPFLLNNNCKTVLRIPSSHLQPISTRPLKIVCLQLRRIHCLQWIENVN